MNRRDLFKGLAAMTAAVAVPVTALELNPFDEKIAVLKSSLSNLDSITSLLNGVKTTGSGMPFSWNTGMLGFHKKELKEAVLEDVNSYQKVFSNIIDELELVKKISAVDLDEEHQKIFEDAKETLMFDIDDMSSSYKYFEKNWTEDVKEQIQSDSVVTVCQASQIYESDRAYEEDYRYWQVGDNLES